MNNLIFSRKSLKNAPEASGVYIFRGESKRAIYIGKAKVLKRRLYSYLSKNLAKKTSQMVSEAKSVSIIKTSSELEALLLEARLVKKYRPKYNSQLRDDKHPLYIKITKEKYPRVLTARKIDEKEKNLAFFGPFPSSVNVKRVLTMLRRIFPYSQHKVGKRGCLYSQIGLCKPCPSEIEKAEVNQKSLLKKQYRKNIFMLKRVLNGNLKSVRRSLFKKMNKAAGDQNYEEAKEIRDKIRILDYITQPITPVDDFLKNPNLLEDIREAELDELRNILLSFLPKLPTLNRIECYDVAHIAGTSPTASMVTFIAGEADKTLYRHFRIRQKKGNDDLSSLKEVAKRRAKYFSSWGIPDLIIVDGGKGQLGIFLDSIKNNIPLVGLAKRNECLVVKTTDGYKEYVLEKGPALNLVKRLRDEAHRFARRYHHKLIEKSLLS